MQDILAGEGEPFSSRTSTCSQLYNGLLWHDSLEGIWPWFLSGLASFPAQNSIPPNRESDQLL